MVELPRNEPFLTLAQAMKRLASQALLKRFRLIVVAQDDAGAADLERVMVSCEPLAEIDGTEDGWARLVMDGVRISVTSEPWITKAKVDSAVAGHRLLQQMKAGLRTMESDIWRLDYERR